MFPDASLGRRQTPSGFTDGYTVWLKCRSSPHYSADLLPLQSEASRHKEGQPGGVRGLPHG